MKIAIFGSGLIGATLARKLQSVGHAVSLANSRGPESLKDLVAGTGIIPATADQAVSGVDVVIISVPFPRIPELKSVLAHLPATTIIADTSNYFPHRDGSIEAIDAGQIESLWVCEQLGRPVVKAWNTILAGSLALSGQPKGTAGRIALAVAGDDVHAVDVVCRLVDDTGFDPFRAGSLHESWRQQPGTPAYCTDLTAAELGDALEKADKLKSPLRRDEVIKKLIEHLDGGSFDQMTASNNAYLLKLNREAVK